jgi:hypothetical protein
MACEAGLDTESNTKGAIMTHEYQPVEQSDIERRDSHLIAVHARAAEEYVRVLVDFVRNIVTQYDLPENHNERLEAKRLVCLEPGCYNRPGNWTPDGRGFCGQHAHVMD